MAKSRTALFIVLAVVAVLIAGGAIGFFAWKNRSGDGQISGRPLPGVFAPEATPEKPSDDEDKPILYFANWSWQAEQADMGSWNGFLDNLKSWNVTTVLMDVGWSRVEPEQGKFDYSRYDERIQAIVDRGMDVFLIMDTGVIRTPDYEAQPSWVLAKYPDAEVVDFYGEGHGRISFEHDKAMDLYRTFVDKATQHFHDKFGDGIRAVGTNFNNQIETRYMQFEFKWTDYSDAAQAGYHEWLADKYGSISKLNDAWGAGYGSFDQVEMLVVDKNQSGFDPDIRPAYVDVMQYRQDSLVNAINSVNEAIAEDGVATYQHFGEVLTKDDAIFTLPLEDLAPKVDYLAIDYNHITGDQQPTDPSLVGFITSYAAQYGAKAIFEDSVESLAEERFAKRRDVLIEESVRWAMSNGAAGIGIANFLTEWDSQGVFKFQRTLSETMNQRLEFTGKPIAVYGSIWLPFGYHGSQDYRSDSGFRDVFQNNVHGMFKLLEDAGYPVAVVSDTAIAEGVLANYDVLVAPYQVVVPEETLKTIRDWNAGGGKLVQDVRFAEFSLTGARDEGKLADMFSVDLDQIGADFVAEPVGALAKALGVTSLEIGDSALQSNLSSGLFTTQWVSGGEGTETFLARTSGDLETLAINSDKGTAYLGFMPGLLYLYEEDADSQEVLQKLARFVVERLRGSTTE